MGVLAAIVRGSAAINIIVGRIASWFALAIVVICFTVVVQRYVFSVSYLWMQDLYIWLNGAMFTAVAGYALMRDDHVRVDIFYRPASPRRKAVIDMIGTLVFLLPFAWIVLSYGWPFVRRSWSYWEGSANVGGLPGLFVLKSFIIGFGVLLALQGLAIIARSILVLRGEEHRLPLALRYPQEAPGPGVVTEPLGEGAR
ncbi:TRAP transporter small permease subunit [Pseudoroseicyclus aestuarii]|uniref:TRAP transporter small permease protein n=1 Tax=Pseudoroseicyclus aestuarii TaxID=1795041 RepID=A0A318T0F3_9RHOB|nr:TRAP transporter small permease subunit [Pseudoroseicyclus aestuarii]PYE83644.1 TRAP-type mannitol/chloroaromatic compound transport system permease small subunit [Pseudoroseicyclus aestuarii]